MTSEILIGTKEQRQKRIGGSEFATVLGINPYKKRIELILEKAGVIADTFEGNEATRRGEALENDIIAMFEDKTGLKVSDEQKEFTYNETAVETLPLVCHIDGMTSDGAVFEVKTTDINSKTWKDGIPEYYKAQLDFNCALAEVEESYIAVGYCNGNSIEKFEYYQYFPLRDMTEILYECEKFTQEVLKYQAIGVVNNGKIIEVDFDDLLIEELETLNEKISKIKLQAKVYEDRKKQIEAQLKEAIGNNNGIETDLYKITMSNRITAPTFDYKISRSGLKIEYKR